MVRVTMHGDSGDGGFAPHRLMDRLTNDGQNIIFLGKFDNRE
jgi:hypothetical protein